MMLMYPSDHRPVFLAKAFNKKFLFPKEGSCFWMNTPQIKPPRCPRPRGFFLTEPDKENL
jgi:hypothetical protein